MENILNRIKTVGELLAEAKKINPSKEELESIEQLEIGELAKIHGDKIEVIDLPVDETYFSGEKMSLIRFAQYPSRAFIVFAKERHYSNYYQLHLILPGFKSRGYAIPYYPIPGLNEICREKGIEHLIVEIFGGRFEEDNWIKRYPGLNFLNAYSGMAEDYTSMEGLISISYIPD